MSDSSLTDMAQAVAATLSVVAAGIAVWATFVAPDAAERKRERYRVFRTLMEYRGSNISEKEPVAALNMVPVVFAHDGEVQKTLNYFLLIASGADNASLRTERYLSLTVQIAKSLGFKHFDNATVDRGYFPLR